MYYNCIRETRKLLNLPLLNPLCELPTPPYIHIQIHIYIYIYICTHAYIHTYLPTYLPTYMHTYILFGQPSDLPDAVLCEVRAAAQKQDVPKDAYTEEKSPEQYHVRIATFCASQTGS